MLSMILIPLIIAMFLAVNMGGSGTAPSFSAAYGSGIIRCDLIPGLFGISVFMGAILGGKKVSMTIGKGILPGEMMGLVLVSVVLLAVACSLFVANLLKVPQSTSQATVCALIGPAWYFDILKTQKLFCEIIPAWFILPLIAFMITFIIGEFIYQPVKAKQIIKFDQLAKHSFLKTAVILCSLYVAFAIGSNNVGNASGPICLMVSNELNITANNPQFLLIMILATLIIAPCFGIGSSVFGNRLTNTTGKEIIEFGPLGAILISLVTATLLVLASMTRGIPTSLVQMNTAAIIGLGISKIGWKEIVGQKSFKKVLTVWIIAPLVSLGWSYLFTLLAVHFGWLQLVHKSV